MIRFARPALAGLAFALMVAVSGCSPSETLVTPKGQLVKGGKPLELKAKGPTPPGIHPLRIEFVSEDGKTRVQAVLESDGSSFSVPGNTSKGIPPGKYKVAVYFTDPGTNRDLLNGMFSEGKTLIRVTVEVGKDLGTIDLNSPPRE